MYDFWAGPPWLPLPPPLNPPSGAPTWTKRVPIYSFSNGHPSAYSSRFETKVLQSCGAKTEIRTPMHTWPTRHPLMACAVLPFLQNSNDYFMLAQSCKSGVICCFIGWLTLRPAPERVFLWLLDMSTDPPLNPICSERVSIDWAWAEYSDDVFKIPWKWPRKNWRTPLKKTKTLPDSTRYIPIKSSQREDSNYIIYRGSSKSCLCLLAPPGSDIKFAARSGCCFKPLLS